MLNPNYCKYFLEHTLDGGGDDSVFYFDGNKLMCDNYDCEHGNNSQENILIGGNTPAIGVCYSKGLKKIVDD